MLSPWGRGVRQTRGAGALLIFALAPVHAREPAFYLGVGAGLLKAQSAISKLSEPAITCVRAVGPGVPVARTLTCDKTTDDTALSIGGFAGYDFNEHVAFELGFVNLPKSYHAKLVDPNFVQPGQIEVEQDSKALFLRTVFTLPLGDLTASSLLDKASVSAVLGLAHWRTESILDIDLTGATNGFRSRSKQRDSGNSLTFGARVNYDLTDAVRVSAAWDRFMDLGERSSAVPRPIANPTLPPFRVSPVNTVDEAVDVFSLNLTYRFR